MSIKLTAAKFLQRRFLGYEIDMLSFSQAGEDIIVRNFFYDRLAKGDKGFYVDVGAFHPFKHSNTYYLYRAGWRGINIDAKPKSMEVFDRLRPDDINLEIGVADEEGSLPYYDFGENSNLNSMSQEYISKVDGSHSVSEVYQVKTLPLARIFEQYVPKDIDIDFLNIDIEGMEEPALSSNDWRRFRPKLIACEVYGKRLTELTQSGVARLLAAEGYELYARVILADPCVNTVFFVENRYVTGD
jgi:FkbM family methyltransferase